MSNNNNTKKQNNTNILGQKIKENRKSKKFTQRALGDSIGKSSEAVRKYETGERQPPISVLYDICEVLDIPISYLIPEENNTLENQPKVIEIGKMTEFDDGVIKILESLGYNLDCGLSEMQQLERYFGKGKQKPPLIHHLFTPDNKMVIISEERWNRFEENLKNYFKFELFNMVNESDK